MEKVFGMKYSLIELKPMFAMIKEAWTTGLYRDHKILARAAVDPKIPDGPTHPSGKWIVYISSSESKDKVTELLKKEMSPKEFEEFDKTTIILPLPTDWKDAAMEHHGLLYLPKPYVVPGGRFNEMYGWDSYFVIIGLLLDDEVQLAKDCVDNHLYQVMHYGMVLNATRSYYLARSHPPFWAQEVLEVFYKTKDVEWLKSTLPALQKTYDLWTQTEHVDKDTGLARYFDFGDGPAPEVLSGEQDESGDTHYTRILNYFKTFDQSKYNIDLYYDKVNHQLTNEFYKGDRTMRESGFDPSDRFGPFSVACHHYVPVCLNSLLVQFENDMAAISKLLNIKDGEEWTARAEARAEKIRALLWNEEDGMFYDWHILTRTQRQYIYVTTFYPMWAGVATKQQAELLVKNALPKLERAGGLVMSVNETGMQWDHPFGWAPTNMIAIEGLRR